LAVALRRARYYCARLDYDRVIVMAAEDQDTLCVSRLVAEERVIVSPGKLVCQAHDILTFSGVQGAVDIFVSKKKGRFLLRAQ
jgi:hypothetical protein